MKMHYGPIGDDEMNNHVVRFVPVLAATLARLERLCVDEAPDPRLP